MNFLLAYLDLSLAHSKGQGAGHAHFHCEFIGNCDILLPSNMRSNMSFQSAYLDLTSADSNGKLGH